jgi:hypothetical protein
MKFRENKEYEDFYKFNSDIVLYFPNKRTIGYPIFGNGPAQSIRWNKDDYGNEFDKLYKKITYNEALKIIPKLREYLRSSKQLS